MALEGLLLDLETTESVSGFSAFDRSQWHIFILIGYPIL